jgi:IS30 family transposase
MYHPGKEPPRSLVPVAKATSLVKKLLSLVIPWVDSQLLKDLGPEQISGFASVNDLPCVSPERIYQYVWTDKIRK